MSMTDSEGSQSTGTRIRAHYWLSSTMLLMDQEERLPVSKGPVPEAPTVATPVRTEMRWETSTV